jgi:predicted lipoprotein
MSKLFVYVFSIMLLFSGCLSKKETFENSVDNQQLLRHISNEIVIPSIDSLLLTLNNLEQSIVEFNNNINLVELNNVRNVFQQSMKAWQAVAPLNYGPANFNSLNTTTVNVFPIDTNLILSKMKQSSFNFNTTTASKYSGFQAIDYLLYSNHWTNTQLIDSFKFQFNRMLYLQALVKDLKNKAFETQKSWSSSGGNFIETFYNSKGVAVGSSMSAYFNMMVYDVEVVKNYKIGLPVGIVNNQTPITGSTNAHLSENFYSNTSIQQIQYSVQENYSLYFGFGKNDTIGMDSYLRAIQKENIANEVANQWNVVLQQSKALPSSMDLALKNEQSINQLIQLHASLTYLIGLLKTDVASVTGLSIYFSDNDGD